MIRVVREEGHYTIKRVERLPKRGNFNLLYHIKSKTEPDTIEKLYRALPNGEYEEILIGGGAAFQATSLTFDGTTNVLEATFADGSVHNVNISSIFETTDATFDGPTGDLTITFADGSTGVVNLYQNATSLQYDSQSGDLTATFLDGNSETVNLLTPFSGTYVELETLINNNELIVGQQYILTDYKTEYYIQGSNTGPIVGEIENIQVVSGFAFFDPALTAIDVGDSVTITELPAGYTGPIAVGDVTTVTQNFSGGFFMRFANGLHNVVGIKFSYSVPRFTVNTALNGATITDGNGKVVARPGGVINTEVHDGTAYMDMTAAENYDVPEEQISLTAIQTDLFSIEAESLTYPEDKLIYSFKDNEIKNEDDVVLGPRKGFILRRDNERLNVNIDKDWRIQRYRRYKVADSTDWNNYILNNAVDQSLYSMGGANAFSVSNNAITEEHKYILSSLESVDFYQDFTKIGTEPNVFLTGQSGAPGIEYGSRFETAALTEFRQDLIATDPLQAKDYTIISLDSNLQPVDNVESVFINNSFNTIFLNLDFQYGESGSLRVDIKDGISGSTFMTHPQITSSSYKNANSLTNITAIDVMFLQNTGLLSNVPVLSTFQLQNAGIVDFMTAGGYLENVRPWGVTYLSLYIDDDSFVRNTVLGGKRVDSLKFENVLINKALLAWDRGQYLTFSNSVMYLTAMKGFLSSYTHRFRIDTGTSQNAKKSLFGYYYDSFIAGNGRDIFNNNLGDLLYRNIDGNNNNQVNLVTFSQSQ